MTRFFVEILPHTTSENPVKNAHLAAVWRSAARFFEETTLASAYHRTGTHQERSGKINSIWPGKRRLRKAPAGLRAKVDRDFATACFSFHRREARP
jgi:hypothetical protein